VSFEGAKAQLLQQMAMLADELATCDPCARASTRAMERLEGIRKRLRWLYLGSWQCLLHHPEVGGDDGA
jgi:hypothetical protein